MAWDCNGNLELEHRAVYGGGISADGELGMEEGEEVSEGVWGKVQKEEVRDVARYILGFIRDEVELAA